MCKTDKKIGKSGIDEVKKKSRAIPVFQIPGWQLRGKGLKRWRFCSSSSFSKMWALEKGRDENWAGNLCRKPESGPWKSFNSWPRCGFYKIEAAKKLFQDPDSGFLHRLRLKSESEKKYYLPIYLPYHLKFQRLVDFDGEFIDINVLKTAIFRIKNDFLAVWIHLYRKRKHLSPGRYPHDEL